MFMNGQGSGRTKTGAKIGSREGSKILRMIQVDRKCKRGECVNDFRIFLLSQPELPRLELLSG